MHYNQCKSDSVYCTQFHNNYVTGKLKTMNAKLKLQLACVEVQDTSKTHLIAIFQGFLNKQG